MTFQIRTRLNFRKSSYWSKTPLDSVLGKAQNLKTIKAPDYHDDRIAGSMDIDQPNEPVMVEENHGQVPSPIAPDHDPVVEHKKVSRKLMIKVRDPRTRTEKTKRVCSVLGKDRTRTKII